MRYEGLYVVAISQLAIAVGIHVESACEAIALGSFEHGGGGAGQAFVTNRVSLS